MTALSVGGPGLHDPCEKELADASSSLNNQEREDLTASAQVSSIHCYNIVVLCCISELWIFNLLSHSGNRPITACIPCSIKAENVIYNLPSTPASYIIVQHKGIISPLSEHSTSKD